MNWITMLQQMDQTLLLVLVGIFALMIGSFLNVLTYRLPLMLMREWRNQCCELLEKEQSAEDSKSFNLFFPRSHCPHCKHAIRAWENIPLISYLFLRGRCSSCKTPISFKYPMIEVSCAIFSIIIIAVYGPTLQGAFALVLTWLLIALTLIDLEHQLLPDLITLPLLWLGLFASLFNVFVNPETAIIGALAGYLSFWGIATLFRLLTGKDGLGLGDCKLLATLGAWIGWQLLPLVVLISALVGGIIGVFYIALSAQGRNTPIPFGPYLALAGWITLLWGHDIMRFYITLF